MSGFQRSIALGSTFYLAGFALLVATAIALAPGTPVRIVDALGAVGGLAALGAASMAFYHGFEAPAELP